MPADIAGKLKRGGGSGPFTVGLINGLMPCGPLQAMQLYALSTGNVLTGALSMLLFSLGTVPLMFALGAMSAIMSHKFSKRAMAVGAVLVAALGLTMLTGFNPVYAGRGGDIPVYLLDGHDLKRHHRASAGLKID